MNPIARRVRGPLLTCIFVCMVFLGAITAAYTGI